MKPSNKFWLSTLLLAIVLIDLVIWQSNTRVHGETTIILAALNSVAAVILVVLIIPIFMRFNKWLDDEGR